MRILILPLLFALVSLCGHSAPAPTPTPSPPPTASPAPPTPTPGPTPTASPGPRIIVQNPLPEGHLLFSAGGGTNYALSGSSATDLHTQYATGGLTSPHGKYVASYDDGRTAPVLLAGPVAIRNLDGALVARTPDLINLEGASWSPDDSMFAYQAAASEGITLMDVPSGTTHFVAIPSVAGVKLDWSPDGSLALVERADLEPALLLNPGTGEATPVEGFQSSPNNGTISTDGRYLTRYTGGLFHPGPWRVIIYDRQTGQSCTVVPETDYEMPAGGQAGPPLRWASDSRHVAITDESGPVTGTTYTRLDIAEPDICATQTIAEGVLDFDWSPDGQTLALAVLSSTDISNGNLPSASLYTWTPAAGLTPRSVPAAFVKWSPDGSLLLAHDPVLGVMHMLGAGDYSDTNASVPLTTNWQWSPSGRYLAMLAPSAGTSAIVMLDTASGELTRIALINSNDPLYGSVSLVAWAP